MNTTTEPTIPDFLDRTKTKPAATPAPAPTKAEATPAPTKPAKTPKVKAAKTGTKPVKVKAEKKGKVVKGAHQPADVVATDENPQKSVVPVRFKQRYQDHGGSNGDQIAVALKEATTTRNKDGRVSVDHEALAKIAEQNGIDFGAYKHLNPGMQRMNVGNRLRGMLKNEQPVKIGKLRFADWEKAKRIAA